MKPVYLSFSGINSFSERVDIDFERLLAGGLFGIFGNTGSGKSTIVDCIMYALFGRSLRNKTIKECVNNRVNQAFVDFTFEISSDGERKKYNVRRTIKIKRGGFETTARLSEIKCGAVYPIEEKGVNERVRDIVGIGYDEFSKCIILPQNEFSAFVSAERARRLEIIEKLFSLSKYDEVSERTSARVAALKIALSEADGELKQFAEYTEEALSDLTEREKALQNAKESLVSELNEIAAEELAGAEGYNAFKMLGEEKEKLKALEKRRGEIERIAEILSRSESAEAVVAAFEAAKASREKVERAEREAADISSRLEPLRARNKAAIEGLKEDFEGELMALVNLSARLEGAIDKAKEIDSLRSDRREKEKELAECQSKIQRLTREKGDLIEKIGLLGDPAAKISLVTEKAGGSAVKREIEDEIAFLDNTKERLAPHAGTPLHGEIATAIDGRKTVLQRRAELLSDVPDAAKIIETLSAAREDLEELNLLRAELSGAETALSLSTDGKNRAEKELEAIDVKGGEIRLALEDLSRLAGMDVTSPSKLDAAIAIKKREAEIVRARKTKLAAERDKTGEEIAALSAELEVKKLSVWELKIQAEKDVEILEKAVKDGGFESFNEATGFAIGTEKREKLVAAKDEFEREVSSCAAVCDSLEKKVAALGFDEGAYRSVKKRAEDKSAEIKGVEASLAAVSERLRFTREKLEEARIINLRRAEILKKKGLCERLLAVVGRHGLLDFVAEEYLSEISFDATTTLLKLTSGRYTLIYNKEFYVRDNLDCGKERAVTTLSGGETFLVSLSLALSLSRAICERTRRPMEFFFMDEGFGTLDPSLTDLVMDSLTSLRRENFSIGLISHVPELRTRITSKILVTPPTSAAGSKIEIVGYTF